MEPSVVHNMGDQIKMEYPTPNPILHDMDAHQNNINNLNLDQQPQQQQQPTINDLLPQQLPVEEANNVVATTNSIINKEDSNNGLKLACLTCSFYTPLLNSLISHVLAKHPDSLMNDNGQADPNFHIKNEPFQEEDSASEYEDKPKPTGKKRGRKPKKKLEDSDDDSDYGN